MRLRTFTAATMSEAMALVRARLGADAIIVSTEEGDDGATRVTAAVEQPEVEQKEQRHAGIECGPERQVAHSGHTLFSASHFRRKPQGLEFCAAR